MSDVHDMSDRELDEAVAEEVMGLTVAGWWPVLEAVMPGGARLLPVLYVNPNHMTISVSQWRTLYIDENTPMRLEPFLRGARCNRFGEVVPAYTTDARETEKVLERMAAGHSFAMGHGYKSAPRHWASFVGGGRSHGSAESAASWKRAVCEAALLAVRGAA